MPSIVDTSLKRPLVVVVIFTILSLGGFISYTMLNLNLIPKFEVSQITIQTIYPGAAASEVETSVTEKIEDALSTLENLKKISSTSMEGLSVISVELNDGVDPDKSVQDAQRKINAIKSDLPDEIKDPTIDKLSLDERAILSVAASSSLSSSELHQLIEDRIQPRLAKIEGVGAVTISGGEQREIKVNIDSKKLKIYNLSIIQVLNAIEGANVEMPAGNIENKNAVYSVRLQAKYNNLEDLKNTVLAVGDANSSIKVKDVAEVVDGIAEQELINRINGSDAIGLSIQKQSDANAVKVAELAKQELESIENEFASDNVQFQIAIDDSVFTKASAHAVIEDLVLAILIVAFICFIFLHDLRSALIIMIAIPLSIIPAFIGMYILGFSLNMMSLISLSLVVGILVDDSIVVVENMFHHLEMGKTKWHAALDGSKQIMFTVMAITFVIVVVFLPMAITGGMIGNILKEFAIPIIITVLCSLFVSFTVTPLLMSRFAKLSSTEGTSIGARFSAGVENIFNSLKTKYSLILTYSLQHKVLVLFVAFILFAGALYVAGAGFIGSAFMPEIDKGEFTISLDMNPQVNLYRNNQITAEVEELLRSKPEIKQVYTNVGMSTTTNKNYASTISVKIVNKNLRDTGVEEFAYGIKQEILATIPGVRVQTIVSSISGSTAEPIQLIVEGTDLNQLQETATMVLNTVKNTPGTADAKFSIDDPRPEIKVHLNREKMEKLGLSSSLVGATLRLALNGNDDSQFRDNNTDYDIRIGIDNFDRNSPEDVAELTIVTNTGELIELGEIADINYGIGPSALERTDRIPSITIAANVVGRPTGTVGTEIVNALDGKIPDGITLKPGGMLELQSDAFNGLALAFLAAIILIYLIMVLLYNSVMDPIIVMTSIPLSFIGAFFALALTKSDLTIFSIIGLIVLIGLVAKNAILLVDFANNIRQQEKKDVVSSLIEAGEERLRPILMTTFAMIFGMLPIALAQGDGAELKTAMAWVIIGGLTSSMLLTLVVVPVVYDVFYTLRMKAYHLKRKRLTQKVLQAKTA